MFTSVSYHPSISNDDVTTQMKRNFATIVVVVVTCNLLLRVTATTLFPEHANAIEGTHQQEQQEQTSEQRQQRRFLRQRRSLIETSTVAVVDASFRSISSSSSSSRSTTNNNDVDERPIMYTYFSKLSSSDGSTVSAGMTVNAHSLMLNVWQETWQQAGWRTKILTIDNAKQHPEFDQFQQQIEAFKTNDYNKACYYRWLAMAAVGGGWMSDYDVLPLQNFTNEGVNLPMEGLFTCYARHVPCLLSGSANEWYRMTKRLVEYASQNLESNGSGTPSDMLGLLALQEKYPYIFISLKDMAPHKALLIDKQQWNKERCANRVPLSARAIHFSHNVMTHIWIAKHPKDTMDDRPVVAKQWLQAWLTQCGRQTFKSSVDS